MKSSLSLSISLVLHSNRSLIKQGSSHLMDIFSRKMRKACFHPFNYTYWRMKPLKLWTCWQTILVIHYKLHVTKQRCELFFPSNKLRDVWIRSDKFYKSNQCDRETPGPHCCFFLSYKSRVISIRSGKFKKVETMRAWNFGPVHLCGELF